MSLYKHEEIYRGKDKIRQLFDRHITVCGVGAVGSNLVERLARQGCGNFRVIDFDRVEEHNINNQIFTSKDVGQYKSAAIEDRVLDINSGNVDAVWKKLDSDNIKKYFKGTELVVDCFDNISSRKLVSDYCKKNKIECLHLGVLTDFGEGVWNEKYQLPDTPADGNDPCDYPLASNIVSIVATIGSELVLDYFMNNNKRSFIVTLKNFVVRFI
jgi:hypothetical protein